MKIDVAGHAAQEKVFPRLMIDTESKRVIFVNKLDGYRATGTLLARGTSEDDVGDFYENWDASDLVDFIGTITLSNG